MLLDQKRTRRIVQVVAVLTSIAFVGVIFVVLGLTVFGGGGGQGGTGAASELIAEAEDAVAANENDAEAWEDLATAHAADNNLPEAIRAAEMSVELAPNEFRRTQTLVALNLQSNNQDAAVEALSAFTAKNPMNGDAFLQLGTVADQAGRSQLARLSYQRFIQLNPDDPTVADIEQRIEDIANGEPAPAAGNAGANSGN